MSRPAPALALRTGVGRMKRLAVAAVTRVLGYPLGWLRFDLVADVTLAAYAVPVSLAYATLAGLPPQVGVYGYLLGGLGYALAGSSRYLAIGPTSAISLMIAGTVGDMAGDDPARYAQIASAAAFGVGVVCLIAWLTRIRVSAHPRFAGAFGGGLALS